MRHELPKDSPDYRPGRYAVKSSGANDYAKGGGQAFSFSNTLGWQHDCKCGAGDPVPCIVLDPFAGVGTVPLVAHKLGRRGIGLELKPDYCRMARERIIADAPLLSAVQAARRIPDPPLGDLQAFPLTIPSSIA